ncbi:MAG: hypothetical protein Q8908_13040 [Bacteroidota bacterium]|nr:hypothetical protein [Bacteroidota bacterium]
MRKVKLSGSEQQLMKARKVEDVARIKHVEHRSLIAKMQKVSLQDDAKASDPYDAYISEKAQNRLKTAHGKHSLKEKTGRETEGKQAEFHEQYF